jgi:hypothetical protein
MWREGGRVADFEEPCNEWRSSTTSGEANCVEVAVARGSVMIRDSADREGTVLRFSPTAWSAFLVSARRTEQARRQA